MNSKREEDENKPFYDRLGGDSFWILFSDNVFDEMAESQNVGKFFNDISVTALKSHNVKLLRVLFGPPEETPDPADFTDYMIKVHSRLFQELGLNETHFDMVVEAMLQCLVSFQVEQHLMEEFEAAIRPLRAIFEYGAKVAKDSQSMTTNELRKLPTATCATMSTGGLAKLPKYSSVDIPLWLTTALGNPESSSIVRSWTRELTDRFGAEGDAAIADTFMDQPYMDHHVYCVNFLKLAFLPENASKKTRYAILSHIMYPRGRGKAKLSTALFDRMLVQFLLTCKAKEFGKHETAAAKEKLHTYRAAFGKRTHIIGGVNRPHVLAKVQPQDEDEDKENEKPDPDKLSPPKVQKPESDDCSRTTRTTQSSLGSGRGATKKSTKKSVFSKAIRKLRGRSSSDRCSV